MRNALLISYLISVPVFCVANEIVSMRLSLGGPRKVVAEITEESNDLKIAVEMLAVACFDQATNARLSRGKAEHYTHEALARYLFPKASNRVTLTLAGATVEKATLDGKHYRLTLRVPRKGVSQKEVAEKVNKTSNEAVSGPVEETVPIKTKEKRAPKINLFEVKGDYAETGRLLFESFNTAIPSLADKSNDDQRTIFYRAIADFEEQADQSFDVLIVQIRQDKLLLTIEADELIQQVERNRAEIMELLKKSVEAAAPSPSNK